MNTALIELKNYIDIDVTLKMCTKEYANRIKWYIDEFFIEKEKQQIIDAHSKGQQWNKSGYNPDVSEQYYKETYETI